VPELEALVREHPLREFFRFQLMLALYRCGRQADALEAYREARRTLLEDRGLEPSRQLRELERAILAQEPALDAPRQPRPRSPLAARRRSGAVLIAGAGALFAAAAVAAVLVAVSGQAGAPHLAAIAANSVGVIDPASNTVVAQVPVGSGPVAIAEGEHGIWVANAGDRTVSRVDPVAKRVVRVIGTGRTPTDIAAGADAVWVANGTPGQGIGSVTRIDARTGAAGPPEIVRRGDEDTPFAPATPSAIAVGAGGVWVNHIRSQLLRVPARGDGPPERVLLGGELFADGLAVDGRSVWAASSGQDRLVRLDAGTGELVASIAIAAAPGGRVAGPYDMAAGGGAVWVADTLANTVSRVDPDLNAVTATIPVGRRPRRLAVGEDAVWVLNAGDGTVSRIDPRANAVVKTIRVGASATDLVAAAGAVWVTVAGGNATEPQAEAASPVVSPLPRDTCSPVLAGGASSPRYLIASSLPHHTPHAVAARMNRAIRLVLNDRGFRAGRYRVGFQACDDSTSEAGTSDPERCLLNAEAYARNRSIIGVIGTYHSACAQIALPIVNTAPSGPVPMISPANTMVGLTKAGPGTVADEPERYYPTTRRNYVRFVGADDRQGAALAMLAEQLGARRAFLLHDDQPYGIALAKYFEQAAARLGLEIVGVAPWHADDHGYEDLARRVAAHHPEAILLAGCVCENGPRLLVDLRRALGADPQLLAPDAFWSFDSELQRIRRAAQGLYISVAGPSPERLTARGRSLLLNGRATDQIDPYEITAAQAAEALVDAIGHSDGTRASVTEALMGTASRNGIAGPVRFDANGDLVDAPVLIYRMQFGASRTWVPGLRLPDVVLDRTLYPPRLPAP